MMRLINVMVVLLTALLVCSDGLYADYAPFTGLTRGDDPPEITDVYDDLDDWLAAVPPVTVIDFTGFPPSTIITDQFADQGVNFVDGLYFINHAQAFTDGAGLSATATTMVMEFAEPFYAIGVMFPGTLRYELFLEGEMVGWTELQGVGGTTGLFAGLIMDFPFDEVRVIDSSGTVSIDNLYFTFDPIPAPGALALLGIAGIAFRRSRRRC